MKYLIIGLVMSLELFGSQAFSSDKSKECLQKLNSLRNENAIKRDELHENIQSEGGELEAETQRLIGVTVSVCLPPLILTRRLLESLIFDSKIKITPSDLTKYFFTYSYFVTPALEEYITSRFKGNEALSATELHKLFKLLLYSLGTDIGTELIVRLIGLE